MSIFLRGVDGGYSYSSGLAGATPSRSLLFLYLLSLIFALLTMESASAGGSRAVWVWEEDSFRLLDQPERWNETFAFLAQQNLTTVYLYADEYRRRNIMRDEPDKYRRLITALHGRGFRAYALLGSMYLKTQEYILPEHRATAVRMFETVLLYNRGSAVVEQFDGLNIDIEPYLLDDWSENRRLHAVRYLDLAAEFMRMKRKAGSRLIVGPAMPFWFDGIEDVVWRGRRQRLSDHVQDIYDYVAIMDYRNFALGSDGIIAHAADEIEYADRTGKTVVIGVETLRTEPRKVTFHGMSVNAMEEQLRIAESEFALHPSYGGFAIHHLGSYLAMANHGPQYRLP